ncbi:HNH endonuclease signature motif containing protein [Sinorhizobium fredii]|uniref:HNH endonuclease signature motif containing protein n=1 Tax=Rhizobium fredii TaxID=380 RepID=UPI00210E5195|nr:HNH endonuclease signature motif containing protein [Sinorhizobium fredii]UTY50430.1 HNH endonuclease [Sinorhizobium fredii]
MKAIPLPDRALLLALFSYDGKTGRLFWNERPAEMFPTPDAALAWNRKHAGKEAFVSVEASGYRAGRINGQRYRAHRVIWKMLTGEEPEQIDHINGQRGDNREGNLRGATISMNMRNAKKPATNTSGVPGINWDKGRRKWLARIGVGARRTRNLGRFDTFEAAVAARKAAEHRYGYHANHGRHA